MEQIVVKKIIEEKAKELSDFLENEFEGKAISEAKKFTIDSIYENRYRIIVSNLKKAMEKAKGVNGLAEFEVWRDESELFLEKENELYPSREMVAEALEVDPDILAERKVFIRIQSRTFDITEQVRQVSKKLYKRLLEREMRPYTGREKGV